MKIERAGPRDSATTAFSSYGDNLGTANVILFSPFIRTWRGGGLVR
jgi:hypothetical protein